MLVWLELTVGTKVPCFLDTTAIYTGRVYFFITPKTIPCHGGCRNLVHNLIILINTIDYTSIPSARSKPL